MRSEITNRVGSRTVWPPRIVLLLMIIGLSACTAVAFHDGLSKPPVPGSDASEYDCYARNMTLGRGYRGTSPDVKAADGQLLDHPTAYRVPATSILWAALFKIFGYRYSMVRITQGVLHSLTILLIFEIGCICFSSRIALMAAAIYTIWPTALVYADQLGSESLYVFLFCFFVFLCLKLSARPTWPHAVASGVVLGLCMLTRGNAVLMVALLIPWSIWQFRRTPGIVVRGLAVSFVAILMLVPWAVRNYGILHSFVPFETGGGDVLLGSYNRIIATDPLYYGYWIYPTKELSEFRAQIEAPNDEVQRDHVEMRLALQWTREHPDKWWYLVKSRFRRSWTPFLEPQSPALYRIAMVLSWGPILAFFICGCVPSAIYFLRSNHPGWILHLGIAHFVLTALVFWGASRFRYPVEGLCIIIASASMAWLWQEVRRRLRPELSRSFENSGRDFSYADGSTAQE